MVLCFYLPCLLTCIPGLRVSIREPSEIRKWMLTEDVDLIRAQDIPERMQLVTSSLSSSSTLSLHTPLTEEDLGGAAMWERRINSLGQKYRSLFERQKALATSYESLQVKNEYYEDKISQQIDSVEVVADATEWLSMKYKDKDKKQDITSEFHFHDDEDPEVTKKRKMPSRLSAYEVTKKSIVSKLAQVRTFNRLAI